MSAIDQVANVKGLNNIGREAIAAAFWTWFYNNQNQTVKIRIWFVNVDVPLSKLRALFVMLFGEDPNH